MDAISTKPQPIGIDIVASIPVKTDDAAIISPTSALSYKSTGPSDLIRYWKGTGNITFKTSGSTFESKALEITPEQLQARVDRAIQARGSTFSNYQSIYIGINPNNTVAVIHKIAMLQRGGKVYLEDSTNIDKSLQMCADNNVESALLSTKNATFQKYLDSSSTYKFQSVYLVGGLCDRKTLVLVNDKLGPVQFNYGCSEVGPISTCDFETSQLFENCVGTILPDLVVKIDDASGEILVQNNPSFTGTFAIEAYNSKDGWVHTGDKGHFEGELLIVEGRL